jgi:hypothetical protein
MSEVIRDLAEFQESEHTRLRDRLDDVTLRVGTGATVAAVALTAVVLVGKAESMDPLGLVSLAAETSAGCSPIDGNLINKYEAAITPAPGKEIVDKDLPVLQDESIAAEHRAKQYGVHLASDSKEVIRTILHDSPGAGLLKANEYTTKTYGFRTTSRDIDPERSQIDAAELISHLHTIPTELIRDIAKEDAKEVILGDDSLKGEAVGDYGNSTQTIRLKPGETKSISHELIGHGLARASSRKHCRIPNQNRVPSIEAANPPGFVYNGLDKWRNATNWNGITFTAYGSSIPAEDFAIDMAMIAGALDEWPDFQQSETIRRKTAVGLATMAEINGNAADYYTGYVNEMSSVS